ncbi:Crp/Fnr family transcriptional regulator [Zwartia sp.]|uniref:Crp/Fnr family transcriptional regulator n=1 Tax=Zwartia sp. TaxID=2978004 RepID=UPI002727E84A|nr:Crp/Fnr family transcriptional regulator [Zwartia sp.]MDO9023966.1 Crp/Fnr family transcriptional regulator [Zwartia sp.]
MPLSLIKSLSIFEGLSEQVLEEIAHQSRTAEFPAGHTLLKAGETPGYLMAVLAGTIQLNDLAKDGRVIGIAYAQPNDLLAWLSLVDRQPVSQTILAATPCKLLVCPIALMQNLMANHAILANRFLQLSADSIRRLEQARAMLSLPNAFHRVFMQINLLSAGSASEVTSLPKQQDIANSVNTSRETVSRALQILIKSGVLRKVGHQIVIKQADALKKLAVDGPEAVPVE